MIVFNASSVIRTMVPFSGGGGDVFVMSLSSAGAFQWLAQSKCLQQSLCNNAQMGSTGEVVISVRSTCSTFAMSGFNNVQISRTSPSNYYAMWAVKITNQGNVAWIAKIQNGAQTDFDSQSVGVSSFNGRVAVAGDLPCDANLQIYDFSDQIVRSYSMQQPNKECSFAIVYDSVGNMLNTIFMQTAVEGMVVQGIAFDSSSNVYLKCNGVAGSLSILNVDGSGLQGNFSLSLSNFVAKFSSTGTYQWLNQFYSQLGVGRNTLWINSAGLLSFAIGSIGGNISIIDSSQTQYSAIPLTLNSGVASVLVDQKGLVLPASIIPIQSNSRMGLTTTSFNSSNVTYMSGVAIDPGMVLFGDSTDQFCVARNFTDQQAAFVLKYLPGTRLSTCVTTFSSGLTFSTTTTTTTTTTSTTTTTATTTTTTITSTTTTTTSTTTTTTTTTTSTSTNTTTPTTTTTTTISNAMSTGLLSSASVGPSSLTLQTASSWSTTSVSSLFMGFGSVNATSTSFSINQESTSVPVALSANTSSYGSSGTTSVSSTQAFIQFSTVSLDGLFTFTTNDRSLSTLGVGSGTIAGAQSVSLGVLVSSVLLSFAICFIIAMWLFLRRLRRNKSKSTQRPTNATYSSVISSVTHFVPNQGTNVTAMPSAYNATTFMNTAMEIAIPAFMELKEGINFRRIDDKVLSKGSQGIVARVDMFNVPQGHWIVNSGVRTFVGKFSTPESSYEVFMQEVALLWKFQQSEYVAKLAAFDHQAKILIMPFFELGALQKLIDGEISVNLTFNVVLQLCYDAVAGIDVLHKSFVVHNDIKSANYLMEQRDGKLRLCLTDFGVCTIVDSSKAVTGLQWNSINGATVRYAAPEVLAKYTMPMELWFKRDIYSVSIVMNEILTRTKAWSQLRLEDVAVNVKQGMRPPSDNQFYNEPRIQNLLKIINAAWAQDLVIRPQAADLVRFLDGLM
ncbi:hypothetical protein MP228_012754 [Amoeboaphelidium protococcarum]|nr:hypothetical protein MP228_012754 [Amoeboaphelidium protococcarum]